MKFTYVKSSLFCFLIATVFLGCNDDEFTAILNKGGAPTGVVINEVISEDNSGTVTVSPTAGGAFSYSVFFGESASEQPVVVGNGGTATNVYEEEGDYVIKVVAKAPNEKTTELTKSISVSLTAILNFDAGITVDEDDSSIITFMPSAEATEAFDILFGDVEGESATRVAAGDSVTHTYPAFGTFTATITAIGVNGKTSEFMETISTGEPLQLPVTFDDENVNYQFDAFNGASYEVVDNPDLSGANAEASKVGALTNSGVPFEGGVMPFNVPVDFSGDDKTIKMKFWSMQTVPVLLKFENGVNGERQNEVIVMHGGTGWEDLTFNFATSAVKSFIDGTMGFGEPFVPTGQYSQIAIFVDGPGTTSGTFYFDNIEQTTSEDNGGGADGCSNVFPNVISFESGESFDAFGGQTYQIVDNPDMSGANPEATKVGEFVNSGAAFEGSVFTLDPPADFMEDNKTVKMKFWSTVEVPVLLKFEDGVSGERQNEVIVMHGGTGWEVLTFDFATSATKSFIDGTMGVGEPFVPTGQYAKIAIFIDGPGTTAGTFYIDDIGFCESDGGGSDGGGDTEASIFPNAITFENGESFDAFNGQTYQIVDNPDMSGANTDATKVGEFVNSGAAFEGSVFTIDPPVDFGGDTKTVTMKFWSTVSVPIVLKFEDGVDGERQNEVVVTHSGSGWELLTFDFANNATKSFIDGTMGVGEPFVPEGKYAKLALFIDGPGTTAGTFYVDDIK